MIDFPVLSDIPGMVAALWYGGLSAAGGYHSGSTPSRSTRGPRPGDIEKRCQEEERGIALDPSLRKTRQVSRRKL